MNVLVIDNYDSFTYNLVQYLGELGRWSTSSATTTSRSRSSSSAGAERLVISPGPCTPADAGTSIEAARAFPEAGVPTLGVCLGHQALVEAFGGRTIRGEPIHGKDAEIEHDGSGVFDGLPSPLAAGATTRWSPIPICRLTSSGRPRSGEVVMAVRHRSLPARGFNSTPSRC